MFNDAVITELLESACPSIRYRICSEILGQSPAGLEMLKLQDQILRDPGVREVLSWQQPDGWLAWDFHGKKGIETGIRILCEKGVSSQYPSFAQALHALENHPERLERGIGKAGRILDDLGFGGQSMIRAAVFAYAGLKDKSFVNEQVLEALAAFRAVLEVNSIEEIVERFRDKLVFKPGVKWPCIYALRLLAWTQNWRTPENQVMLGKVFRRLVTLSPIPSIYVRNKAQWIAPASFCMHDFNPEFDSMDEADWMMWFHRTECLARLGVINAVPELARQVEQLGRMLSEEDGWFTRKLNHPYFKTWGAYSGLRLEEDWRDPRRRRYDLTFRCMLILYHAHLDKRVSPDRPICQLSA